MANFFERERSALVRLVEAVQQRAAGEAEVTTTHLSATERAEREINRARRSNAAGVQKELADLESEIAATTTQAETAFQDEQVAVDRQHAERRAQLTDKFTKAHEKAKTAYKDRLWTIDSILEAGQKEAQDKLDGQLRTAEGGEKRIGELWKQTDPHLARVKLTRGDVQASDPPRPEGEPGAVLAESLVAAAAEREALAKLRLPRFATTGGLLVCLGVFAILAAGGTFPFLDLPTAAGITAGVTLTLGLGAWLLIRWLARQRTLLQGRKLGEAIAAIEAAVENLRVKSKAQFDADRKRLAEQHAVSRHQTDEHYRPQLEKQKQVYEAEQTRINGERLAVHEALKKRYHVDTTEAKRTFAATRSSLEGRFGNDLSQMEAAYASRSGEAASAREAAWNRTASAWQQALRETAEELAFLRDEGDRLFPDWASEHFSASVPDGVPFGRVRVDLDALPDGEATDPALRPAEPLKLEVPAFLPFPGKCSVLLRTRDEGRAAAITALQAMMLRFLTGLPPGKVRFTIIDPVGLGENFASFMHLADHDEKLVTSQIWTEQGQIEKRLVDLTDHIAAVIQKYLRNQYRSIEEYNRAAGEVAEPYRVLVVANFPNGFTPDAAKRLISIANSGPTCGVCTLVSVDTRLAMPRDFNLADLEAPSLTLTWKDGAFVPKDPAFLPFPLTLDTPPEPSTFARIVQRIGKASLSAGRVEVPFSYIRPPEDEVWKSDATRGFEIPIGRAGATRRQTFRLGKGTAQHALIAGKTGSGKSTLLHAIISNLGLMYSPEEAELYLIDFKKGVEFKDYAAFRLPQARVVAIESEREFGLSVLQRLDSVLRERGERFRDAGVNDLAGYRSHLKSQHPGQTCPRILFIVDEFQEFFVEDDKLAQEASLLLDRLVRQGRAFGLHVVLGSQSLGGSYSLPRTTIDQMAVRVALQSSEADAQLILSKDNNAARLLSRPGEAIYNDANGLVEGNDPFQVVWMSDNERERVLLELRDRAGDRYPAPLVFEGNTASELAKNAPLNQILASSETPSVKVLAAWLGEPVAIKEPTVALFRPQSAANLLALGQQEDTARNVFAAVMIGLAVQLAGSPGEAPFFTLLDGTPDDVDDADALRSLARQLPVPTATPGRSDLPAALAMLAGEFEKRQRGETGDRSPRFLFVFGVQRFRELRKAEDDFGFRRGGDREASPAERFAILLREGPAFGIHTILWCDSLTNLQRSVDRQGLKEFGLRVLFQMSPTDSSTLVDSPIASRLGRNRALFVMEEQERPEKFLPYGWPDKDWLAGVADSLRGRVPLSVGAGSA